MLVCALKGPRVDRWQRRTEQPRCDRSGGVRRALHALVPALAVLAVPAAAAADRLVRSGSLQAHLTAEPLSLRFSDGQGRTVLGAGRLAATAGSRVRVRLARPGRG